MIGVLLVASFVVVLNETIMTVAIPRLVIELGISVNTAQWLTTVYLLTMAVVIPTTGFVIQRFPTRVVFAASCGVFLCGTLLAAVAPGFALLLAARIVQAAAAGVMLPLLMTTVLTLAPAGRRGALMGVVTIVLAVAPAIGPALAGLVLQYLHWRYLFVVLLPVAVGALVIGLIFLTDVGTTRKVSLDLPSVALAVLGFGPLVLGLSQLGEAMHGTGRIVLASALVAAGAGGVALFARRQKALAGTGDPVLDVRVFAAPQFRIGLSILLLCMAAYYGALLALPYYLQRVLGLDTLTTGTILLPGGLLMGLMGPLAGHFFDRFGARVPVVAGTGALVVFYTAFAFLGTDTPVWLVAVLYAGFMGLGMGVLSTPAVTGALEALPPGRYAHGNAVIASLQQVAGAAGSAVFAAVFSLSAMAAGPGAAVEGEVRAVRIGFAASAVVAALAFALAFRVARNRPSAPPRPSGAEAAPRSPNRSRQ
ncbi:DHA2 family efflux MFS transporter permease subunit [Streptomyces sp. NPDC059477]|uniref:DHA2 family efflux MFS transporter permease subunit n=1 Tax=Streptomyces sp. NPDC059477 TaxID=3346847 RepID=UPI0036751FAE